MDGTRLKFFGSDESESAQGQLWPVISFRDIEERSAKKTRRPGFVPARFVRYPVSLSVRNILRGRRTPSREGCGS